MSKRVYNFPPVIYYGWGEASRIGGYIRELHPNRVLIVTDKGVQKAGLLTRFKSSLSQENIDFVVYSNVHPNPTDRNVEEGRDVYTENGCDTLVAVGGGSPMDAAKGIIVMVNQQESLRDYYWGAKPRKSITGDVPGFVAVPTTSGTGSEVSTAGIITDTNLNRKRMISSPNLLPRFVILDPELTVSMPPRLTAHTGLDALSHSVEAFAVEVYAPIADAFAREGMRLIAASLIRAYKDGNDRRARENMMIASTLGALAFQKGLGAVHSLAHQLSTQLDVPHGAACGIMIPHVMRFNLAERPLRDQTTVKYAEMAHIFGVDTSKMSESKAAKAGVETMDELLERLSVNPHLRSWGISEGDIGVMAKNAMLDASTPNNPRACKEADMFSTYMAAF